MQPRWFAGIDRWTWVVTGAVALLTVAALTSVLVSRPHQAAADLSTPAGVVTAYVQDIQAGRADDAWNLISPQTQQPGPGKFGPVYTKDEFRQVVASSRRDASSRVRITGVTQSGVTATVQLEVTSDTGNLFSRSSSQVVVASLMEQGGSWRITSDPSPYQFQ
jgi:hypothetical protein